jgi:uncharacterized protein
MSSAGRHLSFPFRIGADGRTAAPVDDAAHVRDEILQLILTAPGERLMQPEIGGGARRLVFEPNGDALVALAKARITQSLDRYLGHRVKLENLNIVGDGETLTVEIKYSLHGSTESRVLRFQRHGR